MAAKPSESNPSSPSLIEYAATMPKRGCHICSLPEINEVNDAIQEKLISLPTIVKWLVEKKNHEKVNLSKLKYHISTGHVSRLKS